MNDLEKNAFLELAEFAEILCDNLNNNVNSSFLYLSVDSVRKSIKKGCKIFGVKYHQEYDDTIHFNKGK